MKRFKLPLIMMFSATLIVLLLGVRSPNTDAQMLPEDCDCAASHSYSAQISYIDTPPDNLQGAIQGCNERAQRYTEQNFNIISTQCTPDDPAANGYYYYCDCEYNFSKREMTDNGDCSAFETSLFVDRENPKWECGLL
jgi:hypothetical protein